MGWNSHHHIQMGVLVVSVPVIKVSRIIANSETIREKFESSLILIDIKIKNALDVTSVYQGS